MKPTKFLFCLFSFLFLASFSALVQAQSVNDALQLFLQNKMNEAESKLMKIAVDAKHPERGKANIALAVIHKLNQNSDDKVKYYVEGLKYLDEPDAYAYTFWGDCNFYNYPAYAKAVKEIFGSKSKIHPDINYCLDNLNRRLFEMEDKQDSVFALNQRKGYIAQWEFLGPFDYNDAYGFNNSESTIQHPDRNYEFKGKWNAPIHWFPMIPNVDASSIYVNEYIDASHSNAVKDFAQTFITSDIDKEIKLTIVCGMDIHCWVNDELVYVNRKNITNIGSLPYHIKVKLKSGSNRLLFQLGKTTEYGSNFQVYMRDENDQPLKGVKDQLQLRDYKKSELSKVAISEPDIESFNVKVFSDYLKLHPNDILEQMLRIEELNSTGDKKKTLAVLTPLYEKYKESYYLGNLYYNNKPNINYSTKDEYLNQKCDLCFSTLLSKYTKAVGDEDKAEIEATLEKLDKYYPNNISVLAERIDYLLDQNEFDKAEALIEKGSKTYENKLMFCGYKSSLLQAQTKKEEHIAYLKSILPGRYNTFVEERMKEYYLEKNDTTSWAEIQIRTMKYDKSDEEGRTLLNIYKSAKKYALAEKVIQDCLQKKPYSSSFHEEYGDLMLDQKNQKKAVEYFEKSLVYYPLSYDIIKKIRTNTGKKVETEVLLPLTTKEVFNTEKVDKIEVPAYLKSKNWVTLFKKNVTVVYAPGLTASKNYFYYKILNEAGITEFKEFSGFGSDVLIFKTNGEVVLPESGFGSMVLPNLSVGDIIAVKYENESSSSYEYLSTKFQTILSEIDNEPIVQMEEEFLIHKSITQEPVLFDESNKYKIEKRSWNNEFNLYMVTVNKPLYVEPELYPKDGLTNYSNIVLQNYEKWDEVADWYWDIASPSLVSDDSLKAIVADILKSNPGLNEYRKAQQFYIWIEKYINYSSQSFRQDNYVPQLPSKVIEDKLGDCKDVSALFVMMCREAGMKANLCLVNMDGRAGITKQYPSIHFNHCIARVYADGKPYFVELTSKSIPFAQNINYSTYGYGLEIEPDKVGNITKVMNEGKNDYFYVSANVSNGEKLKINGEIRISGVTSSILRDAFDKIDSSQITTSLKKIVSDLIPESTVETCGYNAADKWNDTVIISYQLNNDALFMDIAGLYIYKMPPFLNKIVEETVFANPVRNTDFSFLQSTAMIGQAIIELNLTIPDSMTVFKIPSSSKVSNNFFDFTVDTKVNGTKLNIIRKFLAKLDNIKASEFATYKTEMEKAYKNDVIIPVLNHKE